MCLLPLCISTLIPSLHRGLTPAQILGHLSLRLQDWGNFLLDDTGDTTDLKRAF